MKEYVLIRKGQNEFWNRLSADEHRRISNEFHTFVQKLKAEGRLNHGYNLNHGGLELKKVATKVTLDGPFTETKEALLGYVVFRASDLKEAAEISKECPALRYGETLEVYEVK